MVEKEGRPDYDYYCEVVTVMRVLHAYNKLPSLVAAIKSTSTPSVNKVKMFSDKGQRRKKLEARILKHSLKISRESP